MREVTFEAPRAAVMERARMVTAYTASRRGADVYENLAAAASDDELLERYWREALAGVAAAFREWSPVADDGGVTLLLPARYDDRLTARAATALFDALSGSVAGQWLATAGAQEDAERVSAEAQSALAAFSAMVNSKRRPVRADYA